jgi:hypothetical protein
MRYWAYFAAKLTGAAGVMYGLLALITWIWPHDPNASQLDALGNGAQVLLCNLALMTWFLLCAGALYLIVWDQRYRCRVCLRHLRMPVETGSWSSMLQLGRPRTEYICPYGHGTLKQDEFQISGTENPEWTAHSGDIWDELYAASAASKEPGDPS